MTELRQPLLKNTLKVLKNEENKEKSKCNMFKLFLKDNIENVETDFEPSRRDASGRIIDIGGKKKRKSKRKYKKKSRKSKNRKNKKSKNRKNKKSKNKKSKRKN